MNDFFGHFFFHSHLFPAILWQPLVALQVLHCKCWVETVTFPVTVTQQSPAAISMETYQITVAPMVAKVQKQAAGILAMCTTEDRHLKPIGIIYLHFIQIGRAFCNVIFIQKCKIYLTIHPIASVRAVVQAPIERLMVSLLFYNHYIVQLIFTS